MSHYHFHFGNLSSSIFLLFIGGAILATTFFDIDPSLVWRVGAGATFIILGLLRLFNIGKNDCHCC